MAATNQAVSAAQFPMLMWVFAAIIVLCLITFRSLKATLSIVIPLALVSILAYALMAILEIGLKTSTLPVVALGVGVGVDYGIYIYSRFKSLLQEGQSIHDAYLATLKLTGSGVIFTGITLATGCRHLDLRTDQVPGRHGHPPDLHVPAQHGGRDRPLGVVGPVESAEECPC